MRLKICYLNQSNESMKFKSSQSGFTLIELLVVIAIIGLLSSVVLASLSSVRLRARDAAIIANLDQFAKLMELEYSESKTYANLQRGDGGFWASSAADCDSRYTLGNYAAKAASVCKELVKNSDVGFLENLRFYSGTQFADYDRRYSLMVYLPGKKVYACVGTGGKSEGISYAYLLASGWSLPGCYSNP